MDGFKEAGRNISSTESNININIGKAWIAMDKLSRMIVWLDVCMYVCMYVIYRQKKDNYTYLEKYNLSFYYERYEMVQRERGGSERQGTARIRYLQRTFLLRLASTMLV